MVAYSFRRRFVDPIQSGTKCQTIRADRRRHARPKEQMQLYTGMRTKQCELIGRATCRDTAPLTINLRDHWIDFPVTNVLYTKSRDLDFFARLDGFADWLDILTFWRTEHPDVAVFSGVLIRWDAFHV